MNTLDFILFLAATISFAVAAFSTRANPPVWWGPAFLPLGLFFCALDWFIHVAQHQ